MNRYRIAVIHHSRCFSLGTAPMTQSWMVRSPLDGLWHNSSMDETKGISPENMVLHGTNLCGGYSPQMEDIPFDTYGGISLIWSIYGTVPPF